MSHGDEARSFGSYGFLSALNIAPLWADKELWEIRKLVYLSDGIMMGESIVVFNIYVYASYYIWHDLPPNTVDEGDIPCTELSVFSEYIQKGLDVVCCSYVPDRKPFIVFERFCLGFIV